MGRKAFFGLVQRISYVISFMVTQEITRIILLIYQETTLKLEPEFLKIPIICSFFFFLRLTYMGGKIKMRRMLCVHGIIKR